MWGAAWQHRLRGNALARGLSVFQMADSRAGTRGGRRGRSVRVFRCAGKLHRADDHCGAPRSWPSAPHSVASWRVTHHVLVEVERPRGRSPTSLCRAASHSGQGRADATQTNNMRPPRHSSLCDLAAASPARRNAAFASRQSCVPEQPTKPTMTAFSCGLFAFGLAVEAVCAPPHPSSTSAAAIATHSRRTRDVSTQPVSTRRSSSSVRRTSCQTNSSTPDSPSRTVGSKRPAGSCRRFGMRQLFRSRDWIIFLVIAVLVVLLICGIQFGWVASNPGYTARWCNQV